jgi:Ser/Thr protein kinase RdoA (MazF antagonist)
MYDLATYIWAQIINSPQLDWSKQAVFRAMLEGYQAIRPLSVDEFEAIPVFAALRQLFLFGAIINHIPAFGSARAGWNGSDYVKFAPFGQPTAYT